MRRAVLVILALAGGVAACRPSTPPAMGRQVVVTTTIVADLVRAVGGRRVTVRALMGPGIDPHTYRASEGDLWRLYRAELIAYHGLHLEGKMAEILAALGRWRPTTAVTAGLPRRALIPVGERLFDPHVWFDVALWARTLPTVVSALTAIDPEGEAHYRRRAAAYADRLAALDAEVRAAVATVPPEHRVLVTAHDAFAYFGRAYGFEVHGLLGINTSVQAGAADVRRLAEFIARRRVPAIFVESTVPPRYVEALREAVAARGWRVRLGGSLYSDALGDPGGPAGTYVGMVRTNVARIVTALGGRYPSGTTEAEPNTGGRR